MSNYDDQNSTVRWIPRWVRNLLGLSAEDTRPNYSRYDMDRRQMAEKGVNWIPDPIQRLLGLDFSEPKRYGPSEYDDSYRSGYTAPRPSLPPPPAALPPPPVQSASSSSSTGFDSSQRPLNFNTGPRLEFGKYQSDNAQQTGERVGSGMPLNIDTDVLPIGYLLRSYARGALPPQGLEEFTKQARATTGDVWDFYTRWIRFQADEVFRIGRDVVDAVADATTPAPSTTNGTLKRIKVTTVNGGTETTVSETKVTVAETPQPIPVVTPPPVAPVVPPVVPPVADSDTKDDEKPQS
ncbi:MAG: hypothetical protein HC822_06235 [Oscillochloris sp.]|nr:hypothetical protein [Oscillochloris sp.]